MRKLVTEDTGLLALWGGRGDRGGGGGSSLMSLSLTPSTLQKPLQRGYHPTKAQKDDYTHHLLKTLLYYDYFTDIYPQRNLLF